MVRCECSFCILFPVWSKSKVFNICAGTYIFEKASFTSKSYLCVNCSGTLLVSLILIQYPITANCKKKYIYFRKKRGAVFLLLVWKSNFYASMWRLFWGVLLLLNKLLLLGQKIINTIFRDFHHFGTIWHLCHEVLWGKKSISTLVKFKNVLWNLFRFVILKLVPRDHVDQLPVPKRIMDYLKTPNYYSENIEDPSEGGEEQND